MTGLALKIIVGSTRPGRAADRVLPWLAGVVPSSARAAALIPG
jgi:hypothetical protein